MLYITTREDRDAFTAARTLTADIAPDGGLFVPFRLPVFTEHELTVFSEMSFGQAVAKILNIFFSARLTSWDVDFAIGRNPVKVVQMNHKLLLGELWHNPGSDYAYAVNKLYTLLCSAVPPADSPTEWVQLAVRIAVLFGLFSELNRTGVADLENVVDIAVTAEDFSLPMAGWYARKMGLPIGVILCSCNQNGALWDLVRRGEYNPNQALNAADIELERLTQATLGREETNAFRQCCARRRMYQVHEENFEAMTYGLFAAVIGTQRISAVSAHIYRSTGYKLTPDMALCYCALQDYRANNSESRPCLILGDYPG